MSSHNNSPLQQQHVEQQHQQLHDQYVLFDDVQLEQLASDVAKARAVQPNIDKLAQVLAEALDTDNVIKQALASNILQPHPFILQFFTDYIKDSVDKLLTLQPIVCALESDMQQLQEVESLIEQAQLSPAVSTIAWTPSILVRAQSLANILQPAVEAAQQLAQHIPDTIAELAKLQSSTSAQADDGEVTHSCQYCGMPFNSLTDHSVHTHTDHHYKCYVCDHPFTHTSPLQTHVFLHSLGTHMCAVCSKSHKNKSKLVTHVRIHTGEKPFKCTECTESFAHNGNLTKHMLIHTGELFECKVCSQTFTLNSILKVHMWEHHGEKPYLCELCGYKFFTIKSMEVHMKALHSMP